MAVGAHIFSFAYEGGGGAYYFVGGELLGHCEGVAVATHCYGVAFYLYYAVQGVALRCYLGEYYLPGARWGGWGEYYFVASVVEKGVHTVSVNDKGDAVAAFFAELSRYLLHKGVVVHFYLLCRLPVHTPNVLLDICAASSSGRQYRVCTGSAESILLMVEHTCRCISLSNFIVEVELSSMPNAVGMLSLFMLFSLLCSMAAKPPMG